jgi:hypothetical protein
VLTEAGTQDISCLVSEGNEVREGGRHSGHILAGKRDESKAGLKIQTTTTDGKDIKEFKVNKNGN